MFTLKNKQQMTKAIETARRNHPKVMTLALGSYIVRGSAGNFYSVSMKREGGYKAIDSGCVAGQFGTLCYHAAAALAVHMGLVGMRRATRAVTGLLAPRQQRAEKCGAFSI